MQAVSRKPAGRGSTDQFLNQKSRKLQAATGGIMIPCVAVEERDVSPKLTKGGHINSPERLFVKQR